MSCNQGHTVSERSKKTFLELFQLWMFNVGRSIFIRQKLLTNIIAVVCLLFITYLAWESHFEPFLPSGSVTFRRSELSRTLDLIEGFNSVSWWLRSNLKLIVFFCKYIDRLDMVNVKHKKTIHSQQANRDAGLHNVALESISIKQATAVLIMACNRPSIERSLNKVFEHLGDRQEEFAVIVSQDCDHAPTEAAIKKFASRLVHIKQPDRSDPQTESGYESYLNYYKISRHYKWALGVVFDVLHFNEAIVIEDDLEISPDFFDYFSTFLPLLRKDKTLYCISAWNDNAKPNLVSDDGMFYRTDMFPGLGWMLRKSFWDELKPKWPGTFWDDWLRLPDQRQGRACIYPEFSRVLNFGREGVSNGQFFDEHIGKNVYQKEKFKFDQEPERFNALLYDKRNYDDRFLRKVYDYSTLISTEDLKTILQSTDQRKFDQYSLNENTKHADNLQKKLTSVNSPHYCGTGCLRRYRLEYDSKVENWRSFVDIGQQWQIMTDIRGHIPRTSYQGIVCWKSAYASPPPMKFKNMNRHNASDAELVDDPELMEKYVSICLAPKRN